MRLTYARPHNLSQLHDELLTALPALRTELRVEGLGDEIRLTVPDEIDEAIIATIGTLVTNHTPKPVATLPALIEAEKSLLRTIDGSSEELTPAQLGNGLRALLKLVRYRSGDI